MRISKLLLPFGLWLVISIGHTAHAQDKLMSVIGEPTLSEDQVITSQSSNMDTNGNLAAGILFRSDISDLSFQSMNGIIRTIDTGNEWLVLVSTDERVITAYSPGYLPKQLILSEYGISLSSGQVTEVTLASYSDGNTLPVSFSIMPSDARLLVDGRPSDYSRLVMLSKGQHTITVQKEGYKEYTQQIQVNQAQQDYQINLERAGLQVLTVITEPAGADVYIDGIKAGTTGPNGTAEIYRYPGTYEMTVLKSGYRSTSRTVTLRQNANNEQRARLEQNSGTLTVTGNPQAARILIDRYPIQAGKPVHLSPGRHQMDIEVEGYQTYTKEIQIGLGQNVTERYNLEVYSGSLAYSVNIQNARVRLMDASEQVVQQWFGNKTLQGIPVGSYTLLTEATNYNPQRSTVSITRDETRSVTIQLNQNQGGTASISTAPASAAGSPPPSTATQNTDYYVVVDQMPRIIGGMKKLYEDLDYPVIAQRNGIEGRVTVQFIVNTDGTTRNVKVLRGIGGGCDEAAVKAITNATFEPGILNGQAVRTLYTMPVNFRLR